MRIRCGEMRYSSLFLSKVTVHNVTSVFPLLQQTKRKLDDASKRLEFLYDKLREQTVSFGVKGRIYDNR